MFVTRICRQLAMTQAVVPRNSSVFSAVGVLTADYIRRYSRTVEWDLRSRQPLLRKGGRSFLSQARSTFLTRPEPR